MTNNQILQEILNAIDFDIKQALQCFKKVDKKVSFEDVSDVLKTEDEENFIYLSDEALLMFLDGLIKLLRGPSDNKPAKAYLTNNLILKKLRVAYNLKEEDILNIFSLSDIELTKSQLGSYFRKDTHPNFKKLSFSKLRKFLKGLKKYRDTHGL